MAIDAIELPARDRELLSQPERAQEDHKGILQWMGRHKLVTALAGTTILAGGIYATPGAVPWIMKNLTALRAGASKRVAEWLRVLGDWLYTHLVPASIQKGANIMKSGKDAVGRAVDDARLMAKYPGATAKGFGEGLVQGGKNIAEGAVKSAKQVGKDASLMAKYPKETAKGFVDGFMGNLRNIGKWFTGGK